MVERFAEPDYIDIANGYSDMPGLVQVYTGVYLHVPGITILLITILGDSDQYEFSFKLPSPKSKALSLN